ncbi:MAG: hypothetical protein ACOH1Y_12695 [Propionicimonas sp.]
MNGILIISVLILLLIAALQPAHWRVVTPWRPGLDTRNDRDQSRLADELRAVAQREADDATRGIVHLSAPRSAATDARLITRTAA